VLYHSVHLLPSSVLPFLNTRHAERHVLIIIVGTIFKSMFDTLSNLIRAWHLALYIYMAPTFSLSKKRGTKTHLQWTNDLLSAWAQQLLRVLSLHFLGTAFTWEALPFQFEHEQSSQSILCCLYIICKSKFEWFMIFTGILDCQ
jgi:hypothetical protein